VDTGASCCILASRFFDKIRSEQIKGAEINAISRHKAFYSANASPMPVKADFNAEVKIGAIAVPFTVAVVDNLSFDLILGMDFYREAHAIVIVRTNTLSLFDGLTEVPMTAAGEYPVVSTDRLVTIPPLAEEVFPVVTAGQLAKGSYAIDGDLQLPCRTLPVARTLVDGTKGTVECLTPRPFRLSSRQACR
jgi:hypothetical protein